MMNLGLQIGLCAFLASLPGTSMCQSELAGEDSVRIAFVVTRAPAHNPIAARAWSGSSDDDSVVIVLKGVDDDAVVRTRLELLVRRNYFDIDPETLPDSMRGAAQDRWLEWSDDGGRETRWLTHELGGVRLAVVDLPRLDRMLRSALHPSDTVMLIRVSVALGREQVPHVAQLPLFWPL